MTNEEWEDEATIAGALREFAATTEAQAPPNGYRVAWLAAQFAVRQERLARLDFLSAACVGALIALGLVGLAILLVPGFIEIVRSGLPNVFADAAPYLLAAVVLAGCMGVWAVWDRRLGSPK